jgi:alkanesulfonate monooxygenase SsuD/methylene tetrahydromethanopterin reductase-like flavin-dependent oxidoreductase (luciferase family)
MEMEMVSIEDDAAKWDKTVEISMLAEALGYDSIWTNDHFHNAPVQRGGVRVLDPADRPQSTHHPRAPRADGRMRRTDRRARWSKMSPNLDVTSGGRLDWGIGAGWYQHKVDEYAMRSTRQRTARGPLRRSFKFR